MVRQLRDRVLEVCCEEQMAKLSRQEARMMEEERARQHRCREEIREERESRRRRRGSLGENQLVGYGRLEEDSADQQGVEQQLLGEDGKGCKAARHLEDKVGESHEEDKSEWQAERQGQDEQGNEWQAAQQEQG